MLLNELTEMCNAHLQKTRQLKTLNDQALIRRSSQQSWNILECIEHLNRYGRYYLPEINSRLQNSDAQSSRLFKSGLLGNYFAMAMLPKPASKSMNTFKEMNPLGARLNRSVLQEFENQLLEMIEILQRSKSKNLNRIKTSISISKWIKLKLGDTLRVVIYHNERHLLQALKLVPANPKSNQDTRISF